MKPNYKRIARKKILITLTVKRTITRGVDGTRKTTTEFFKECNLFAVLLPHDEHPKKGKKFFMMGGKEYQLNWTTQ